jgi:hypothetical protein
MKALSLWQPHAQAIAVGLKPYETRDWATSYRGPLAIHAAKRLWTDAGAWHDHASKLLRERSVFRGTMVYGAVVCTAELVDCVRTEALRGRFPAEQEFWGNFGEGRYAFRLANVQALPAPIPWRGQQGFFEVDLGMHEAKPRDTQTLSLFGEEVK